MKKALYTLPLAAVLLLSACSEESTNKSSGSDEKITAETVEDKPEKKLVAETVESVEEKLNSDVTLMGTPKKIYVNEEINLVKKSGPAKVTIKELRILDLDVDEQYVDMLKGETAHIVALKIETKNTSKKSISFNITGSKMLINGEQKDAQYFNDEHGEIMPGATVEGEIFFVFKKKLNNVNEFTWYTDRPSDPRTWRYIGTKNIEWKIKLSQ